MIKAWEEIIHTSIIGTGRKQINKALIPDDLLQALEQVNQSSVGPEQAFLQVASLVYAYRRSGSVYLSADTKTIEPCEPEDKAYCSPSSSAVLQNVLDNEYQSLLYLWLLFCSRNNRVVSPELVPALLEYAASNRELRGLIFTCAGKRGKWLSQFHANWNINTAQSFQELFDNGKFAERKEALRMWREQDADTAREALVAVWKKEAATARADLLSVLETGASISDEPFLKEAMNDKSQKVKESAVFVLKKIPGSYIVNEIWEFVKGLTSYQKSSGLLGLMGKESIKMDIDFELPLHFRSYGISHLDKAEGYSEQEFSLNQMIELVPPSYWEKQFDMNASGILQLLAKNDKTGKYIHAIAESADHFRDMNWALTLFREYNEICLSMVNGFDPETREKAMLELVTMQPQAIYNIISVDEKEWSTKFTISLLRATSKEPYNFNMGYYRSVIHCFPVEIIGSIDSIQVEDPLKKNYWNSIATEIKKMLEIKQQIIKSF